MSATDEQRRFPKSSAAKGMPEVMLEVLVGLGSTVSTQQAGGSFPV